jgi:hypothetical protein
MKRTATLSTTFWKTALVLTALVISVSGASATQITDISHSPGIISAGDEVNISLMLQKDDILDDDFDIESRINSSLEPGSFRSERYIEIVDRQGAYGLETSTSSFMYPEGVWNERYTIKVSQEAPTGTYELIHNLDYISKDSEFTKHDEQSFSIHIDREGPQLTASTESTEPNIPRSGDNYVTDRVRFTNTGEKKLENLVLRPETPEGIEKAFSSDEKFLIGAVNPGDSQTVDLGLDISEDVEPGLQEVVFNAEYEDSDSNVYSENLSTFLRVEGRPDLEVINSSMEMKAGETSQLRVKVENTGEQDAESVTARVIAERSQPFSLEDRSNYIGEIESGQTGEAVMKISADRTAALKQHQVKIQLRANGDSEEGDHSVYTFTEQTAVELTGRTESSLIYVGIAAAVVIAVLGLYRYRKKSKTGSEEGDKE